MSKVAIQGNASGTGTFTIAAPNSNTDRTLTLPDEAGTVLTSAATVSDVPTMIKEGTWTPTAEFTTTNPSAGATTGVGSYQRIGSYVTVFFIMEDIDTTGASGELVIKSLPYTIGTVNGIDLFYGTAYANRINVAGGSAYDMTSQATQTLNGIQIRTNEDNATAGTRDVSNITDDTSDIRGTVTYYTTDAF